jgi:hypothetical protein
LNRNIPNGSNNLVQVSAFVPAFSKSRIKIKSFASMLREGGKNATGLSILYDLSAENMEWVSTLLDSIMDGMQQDETVDISTLNCNLMQMLELIRDIQSPISRI